LGSHGKLIFKFVGQNSRSTRLAWKAARKSKKFKIREDLCVDDISQGKELTPISVVSTIDDEKASSKSPKKFKIREDLCVDDISQGKELTPISVVNTIDDEKPAPFKYITSMIYPHWCHPLPLKGCNCINGCLDSEKCSCSVKNGGEIPFNYNGAIVEAKPLVYECGPSCKCPSSCHNRVSQHGIKFQLEIFKTKSKGMGCEIP
jgi:hypothetical protein